MKLKKTIAVAIGCIAVQAAFAAPAQNATSKNALKNDNDRVSYTIGVDMGKSLKAQDLKLNVDLLAKGIKDGMSGGQLLMTQQEMRDTLMTLQQKIVKKQQAAMVEEADKNLQAGKKFLAENKAKPGVKTTTDGLQYKVIKAGKGTSPKTSDVVTVQYEGKTLDGKVFDSTYKRGKPATFKLSQVIKGWQEALQMMKPGATWELYIPPQLAYGKKGLGGPIGPNETLIFKVQLISVGDKAQKSS